MEQAPELVIVSLRCFVTLDLRGAVASQPSRDLHTIVVDSERAVRVSLERRSIRFAELGGKLEDSGNITSERPSFIPFLSGYPM